MLCCALYYAALQALLHDATTVCMHESVVSICQRIENSFIFFFSKKKEKKNSYYIKRKNEAGHSFVIVQEVLSGKVFFFLVEKEKRKAKPFEGIAKSSP